MKINGMDFDFFCVYRAFFLATMSVMLYHISRGNCNGNVVD